MKYDLVFAKEENVNALIEYKYSNILDYAVDIAEDEKDKIKGYVSKDIPEELDKCQMILVDDKVVGCLIVKPDDGFTLLDEIFIEEEYRNLGIGTDIINNILNESSIVCLWVYKLNEKAIRLYKRLGFEVLEDTKNRYYMKYSK
jgi:ribosomal protein S18 acetylase RimI-like enzyme